MAKLRAQAFLLVLVVSIVLVASMPSPGGHHEHTHFVIHVPELIHKHHHTHVKKIHIKHEEDDGGHDHVEEW
ncbi:uncharacterized protein LOC122569106 [Bombus pyrosoma]|nr:uncharacterized protein LOC122569106 [Bombus pyrosoma]